MDRLKGSARLRMGALFAVVIALAGLSVPQARASEFSAPWRDANTSLVIDAYEYTKIDWGKLVRNRQLVGFINKASDGLPPKYGCQREKLCRALWKRYAAARELYHTRKHLARALGMKWGAYHLARPGNPIRQAQHFLSFARPDKDDLLALDLEDNDPSKWMSLKDAETFARYIKKRVGRYPVLYTNHSTARYIARNADRYPLLARLNLWYARYKADVRGVFPIGNWDSYTLWQFSAQVNCNRRSCLKRLVGTTDRIDINVANMAPAELRRQWPFAELRAAKRRLPAPPKPTAVPQVLASASDGVDAVVTGSVQAAPPVRSAVALTTSVPDAGPLAMAAQGYVAVPVWRPGARVVRRVPVSVLRTVASLDEQLMPVRWVRQVSLDKVVAQQKRRFPWYRLARTRYLSDEIRERAWAKATVAKAPKVRQAEVVPVPVPDLARPAPWIAPQAAVFTGRGRLAPVFLRSSAEAVQRQVWMLQSSFLR